MLRIVAGVLLLSSVLSAQTDVPPATKPSTPPATLPADASTPKGALRMLFAATDAGDEAAIRARLYTASPLEEKMADATARGASATTGLYKALVTAFGAKETHAWLPDPAVAARNRDQRVPLLVEKIAPDGQTAVVNMEGLANVEPFEFVKVGDEWKLRVGAKLQTVPAADVERQVAMVDLQLKIVAELTADVAAGKFKSIVDVRQTMEAKVRQANMEFIQSLHKAAATRPAQPAE